METVMLLKYERLPFFCFKSGIIGQVTSECISVERIPVVNGVEKPLFGAWLKAEGIHRNFFLQDKRGTLPHINHLSISISNANTSGLMTMANTKSPHLKLLSRPVPVIPNA